MEPNTPQANLSWSDQFKSWFYEMKAKIINWWNSLNITPCKIIEILAYFGIGFFIGFLLKRYFKYLVFGVLILILTLILLNNFNIINIDWTKIREFTGIYPTDTVGKIFENYLTLIKENLAIVISGIIGFVIGYKVG